MTEVQKAFIDGVCPECGCSIDEDIQEGDVCSNCDYKFWLDDSDAAINGYYQE